MPFEPPEPPTRPSNPDRTKRWSVVHRYTGQPYVLESSLGRGLFTTSNMRYDEDAPGWQDVEDRALWYYATLIHFGHDVVLVTDDDAAAIRAQHAQDDLR